MAKYRCTFFINTLNGGWTETFWLDKSSVDQCIGPCQNMGAVRARLLAQPCVVKAVRMSSVEAPRVSLREYLNYPAEPATTGTAADVNVVGVQCTLTDATVKYQRRQILRGIPDSYVQRRDGDFEYDLVGNAALLNRFNALITSLRSNGFMFRARNGEGAAATQTNVVSFTLLPGSSRVQYLTANPPVPGSYVTISGVTGDGSDVINKGSHRVRSVLDQVVTLETEVEPGVNPVNWTGGKWRVKETGYFTVQTGQMQYPGSRDTGRPFGLRRGRQSAKR